MATPISESNGCAWRTIGLVLLGFVAVGCDARCAGQSPPPTNASESVEPEAEPATAPNKELREVRVTAADVDEIPVIPTKVVPAPEYTRVKPGKPKTLMEEPFLRLSWQPWPLSATRGFVVVHEGPDVYSPVVEARLVDFDTGDVLARVDELSQGEYAEVGVAFGETKIDGVPHLVLVHADDGLTVPLWPLSEEESRRVFINAGTGEAWVFQAQPEYDWDGAAEDSTVPPYRFAFWGDLRAPPPEPSLPFWHELAKSDWEPPAGWLGPTGYVPARVPLFVATRSEECPKVELLHDGYRCSREWVLTGGWRGVYDDALGVTVMTNEDEGVVQRLEIGESCGISEVTLEPPRAVLGCADYDGWMLWSPDAIVKVPELRLLGFPTWARKRQVLVMRGKSFSTGALEEHFWIDLVSQTSSEPPLVSALAPYSIMSYSVFRDRDNHLGLMQLGTWEMHPIPPNRGCLDGEYARQAPHGFAVTCSRTTGVFSFSQGQYMELPRLEEFWLLSSGGVIGVEAIKGRRRLRRWPAM